MRIPRRILVPGIARRKLIRSRSVAAAGDSDKGSRQSHQGHRRPTPLARAIGTDFKSALVIAQWKPRHRHQEFLDLLRRIKTTVPSDLDIHLIVNSYCTHKNYKINGWLAERLRFHFHFTPTYASWLDQIERWFTLITK
jgi:transposase